MFRKLLSNLPFNPSLIHQLTFYSKRMKKESSIRRMGAIFIVLAMFIQFAAVLSPAQPSVASSSNDVIPGGFSSRQQAVNWCNGNAEIRGIYARYGITCAAIGSASVVTRNTHDYGNQMYSLGRLPYGKAGEHPVYANGKKYYARLVSSWGRYNFRALEGKTTANKTFLIMFDCGNPISIGKLPPIEQPKKPDIATTKTVSNAAPLKGQTFTYTITVKNNGPGAATGAGVRDEAPSGVDFVSVSGGLGSPRVTARLLTTGTKFNLAVGQSTTYKVVARLTVDGPLRLDNTACAVASNGDTNGNNNCGTAIILVRPVCPLPGKSNLPLGDPNCNTPGLKIEKTTSNHKLKVGDTFTYQLKVTNTGDVDLSKVLVRDVAPGHLEFTEAKEPGASDFTAVNDKTDYVSKQFSLAKGKSITIELKARVISGTKDPINNEACALGYTAGGGVAGGCDKEEITVEACGLPGKENLPPDSEECRPCADSEDENDTSVCIELSKQAANETQNISDANGTTAHAGDTITYTLRAKNTGSVEVKTFAIEENIGDILDYADVTDAHGGTLDKATNIIKWPAGSIAGGVTMEQKLTVKVKDPIPQTTKSSSNPGTYDLTMTNVYGNKVDIKLPGNVVKTTEQVTTTLPNTGPGTSLLIGFVVTTVIAYFFARSRLMVTELAIAREEYSGGF
ncbi:DUF11 domain-containing protein [Candidatus Saccharibacteria bacterium]|nr:DUF11 domain-containing protein [Candidatus Saccharibacteria bacterium]